MTEHTTITKLIQKIIDSGGEIAYPVASWEEEKIEFYDSRPYIPRNEIVDQENKKSKGCEEITEQKHHCLGVASHWARESNALSLGGNTLASVKRLWHLFLYF